MLFTDTKNENLENNESSELYLIKKEFNSIMK